MAFRFLTGFFGSPILATGGATIADLYVPKKRTYGMSIYDLFATSAPSLGPLVGGFAAHVEGWRWTIWEIMCLSGATLVLLFFFSGDVRSPSSPAPSQADRKSIGHVTFRDGCSGYDTPSRLSSSSTSTLLSLTPFFIYSSESFPIVFVDIYHWCEQMFGLSFLGIFVGTFVIFAYLYFVQEPKYNDKGELKPEERMPIAIVDALILPVCPFWFGWTSRASVHWTVPTIGSSLSGIAALLLFNAVLNYLADAYPASVLAGNDCIRSIFGVGFPLFAGAMYRNLGVGQASMVLALLACAFVPYSESALQVWRTHPDIRMASKRALHDYNDD
ncbi:major facilitator superfamily domain-containing protein [Lactarius akahatsu]|uniref:Major facilitator superfamily domain-containing protein n=1 Tax=Lactarius akahatsu TaxID=416441 RepID=A0AAD4L9H6_9AGAM|nr:major facilitator superfamily domain-containing protein [Lactarius akahatsu]